MDDISSCRNGSKSMGLLQDPIIVSPHVSPITATDVNADEASCNGRFLLVGSSDCTISVYDLSRLGSELYHEKQVGLSEGGVVRQGDSRKRARRKPVAQSKRMHASIANVDNVNTGSSSEVNRIGHRYSVQSVQWYPVDTGVFISLESGGLVHLWYVD